MQPTKLRGSRLRSRPFCVTILLLSLLTASSFLVQTQHSRRGGDRHDGSASIFKRSDGEPECGEVHSVADQCAFIKRYCKDDDAGLIPYLELYYCTLSNVKPVAFTILVLWLGMLFTTIGIAASDFFSVNLSTIAAILGLSESLTGVTFLAFGNGSPDVFSTFAAMSSNSPSMAVGELIGAACFITGVVAGSMALVREFRVDRKTYARDIGFFVIAVGFTMAVLADGRLHFWECWVMIGYYVVYVLTVVGWHWYATKRRRRLRREGEARSHFYGAAGQSGDELAGEPYRDDPDDVDRGLRPPSRTGTPAGGDAVSFDRGPRIEIEGRAPAAEDGSADGDEDDTDGDHERMVAAEVTRSMRVLRTGAKRHHNMTPIRPSLVGALEFRSALAQLQREGNLQLSPISGRSHSENHLDGRARRGTICGVPDASHDGRDTASTSGAPAARRDRALSSGDMPVSSAAIPKLMDDEQGRLDSSLLLPKGTESGQRAPTPGPSFTIGGNLAPPPAGMTGDGSADDARRQGLLPRLRLQIPSRRVSYSEMSSPSTPFPRYADSPMAMTPQVRSEQPEFMLPGSAFVRRHSLFSDLQVPVQVLGPVRWWPYSVLPPPHVLLTTMFPTLEGWREKTIWDKFLSTVSVPSIFLLVITLPVVDPETNEEDTSTEETAVEHRSHRSLGHLAPVISVEPRDIEWEGEWERYRRHTLSRGSGHRSLTNDSPNPLSLEQGETAVQPTAHVTAGPSPVAAKPASDLPSPSNANNESPPWDRWLVCLQRFTGPQFAVFILWANWSEDWEQPGRELVRMVLYTLVGSLVLLGILLVTTTEHTRPRFHYSFCFLGFIISIAWISTIAGEVVGVLKTIGVILGISEALLGLPIFAAGNSIGDLVADITVARLGYPVMALSACFGGPMLNILLGIGIGGVMMMVQSANRKHAKHPERPMEYGPYPVQVGGTLLVSSITLLIILVLLLIVVPLNKWVLSRKIGWGLIALWTTGTILNVVVEATGIWGEAD
ncbi:putative cation exchanger C3A12.06c [Tolypocladium ophioglossoides CBS 100239]|uniref:Putative cation exchanger C3A12.06c n=1 Tax=Tolypocladium ophioglossoides (strain CBS 100239) TaxID=1163406 RepID=A0A0L0NM47_TOLOC|nr:putative cation exchanger C3A12.06c [Tolypocladium ophioglossoides CBS 100239]